MCPLSWAEMLEAFGGSRFRWHRADDYVTLLQVLKCLNDLAI